MIKAIIFDIGNVIYKFDNKKFVKKIAEHSKKSSEELYDLIYKTELIKKYESGKITSQEFYTTTKEICSIEIYWHIKKIDIYFIFKRLLCKIKINLINYYK